MVTSHAAMRLRDLASSRGIVLAGQKQVAAQSAVVMAAKHHYDKAEIKAHFDELLHEAEQQAHRIYRQRETEYGQATMAAFAEHLIATEEIGSLNEVGGVLAEYFGTLNEFFLSLAQGRRARAGKTFESIHNALFKELGYPFDEQAIIDGQPDFLMPSVEYFRKNPMDCVIFTTKRTVRERWRQIVTEGTRGLGFYLATIDEDVSPQQLKEILGNRIYLVCPQAIKEKRYQDALNVLSFRQFFAEVLDPAMVRWQNRGVI